MTMGLNSMHIVKEISSYFNFLSNSYSMFKPGVDFLFPCHNNKNNNKKNNSPHQNLHEGSRLKVFDGREPLM